MKRFRDSANTYAMIYLPQGKNIAVNLAFFKSAKVQPVVVQPKERNSEKIRGEKTYCGDVVYAAHYRQGKRLGAGARRSGFTLSCARYAEIALHS
jgi:hypothetical protein